GVNDFVADGNQPYTIIFDTTGSGDGAYAAIKPTNVSMSNIDNDSAGFTVNVTDSTTGEDLSTGSFTVVLTSQPTGSNTVTVNYHSSNTAEGTVFPASLLFPTTNGKAAQTVTATGVNDFVADGNQPYTIIFDTTGSGDGAYAAIKPTNVSMSNIDNFPARRTVNLTDSTTGEDLSTGSFTVVLTSQPTGSNTVTVNYHSSNTAEGTVLPASLLFTTTNWNAPQTVTATGVNDFVADGNQPYTIIFDPTGSGDGAYAAIKPTNVSMTNSDNDRGSSTVNVTDSTTGEDLSTGTFTVVLTSQPTGSNTVTVNYHSSNTAEGTVAPAA